MSYPQGYLYQPPGSLALYSCPAYGASALAAPRSEELARSSSGSAFSPYPGSAAFTAQAAATGFASPLQYSADPAAGFPSYMVTTAGCQRARSAGSSRRCRASPGWGRERDVCVCVKGGGLWGCTGGFSPPPPPRGQQGCEGAIQMLVRAARSRRLPGLHNGALWPRSRRGHSRGPAGLAAPIGHAMRRRWTEHCGEGCKRNTPLCRAPPPPF